MTLLSTARLALTAIIAVVLTLAPAAVLAQDPMVEPSASPLPEPTSGPATGPAGAWLVTAFDAWETGLAEPLPGSPLRLTLLPGGQLQGETACGRFDGGWAGEGSELVAGVAPTGFLGCADAQTSEAIGLGTALGAVVAWQPDAVGGLELVDAAGAIRLVLQPLATGDPAGTWQVTRYRRPNGEWAEPAAGFPMELDLLPDGVLEGSTGCRLLLGAYEVDAGDLTIGPFDPLGLPCEGEAGRAERRLLRALGTVTTWEQAGDSLVLGEEGEPVVELVRATESAE